MGEAGTKTVEAPIKVRRALISAYHPERVLHLAQELQKMGVELWASDGTSKKLMVLDSTLKIESTVKVTGITSWFKGRTKTFNEKLLSGVIAPRDEEGLKEIEEHGIIPFDLVAVDMYPFRDARSKPGATPEEVIEKIDVGGPSIARGGAKNHKYVVSMVNFETQEDVDRVLSEMRENNGGVSFATSQDLAGKTFEYCAAYDVEVASWMKRNGKVPVPLMLLRPSGETMRYGENPHQPAFMYSVAAPSNIPMLPWPVTLLKGSSLSYNNWLDLDYGVRTVVEFNAPTAVVTKHAIPCGAASAPTIEEAVERAIETDSVARYGCGLALNVPINEAAIDVLKNAKVFVDLISGPEFSQNLLETRLNKRPKLKVVRVDIQAPRTDAYEMRTAGGRVMLQEIDRKQIEMDKLHKVTTKGLSNDGKETLDFAWRVVRHVRSNAIALARRDGPVFYTVGIGSGRTSRVAAVKDALEIAGKRAGGAFLGSDAFFPFADGVDKAGKAKVKGIVQPGGSQRDEESIAMANKHHIAMYFTGKPAEGEKPGEGWRVFRH